MESASVRIALVIFFGSWNTVQFAFIQFSSGFFFLFLVTTSVIVDKPF